jgi:hypothetical protein
MRNDRDHFLAGAGLAGGFGAPGLAAVGAAAGGFAAAGFAPGAPPAAGFAAGPAPFAAAGLPVGAAGGFAVLPAASVVGADAFFGSSAFLPVDSGASFSDRIFATTP